MKVICVKNISDIYKNHFNLTVDKEYDADIKVINHKIFYCLRNDLAIKNMYDKSYFITKEEYRNKKLEELGI
jgi:hypothetical protein